MFTALTSFCVASLISLLAISARSSPYLCLTTLIAVVKLSSIVTPAVLKMSSNFSKSETISSSFSASSLARVKFWITKPRPMAAKVVIAPARPGIRPANCAACCEKATPALVPDCSCTAKSPI